MPEMRTRTKMKNVASDRARRENVLRHILSYCYRKRTGATGLVLTNKVEGQRTKRNGINSILCNGDETQKSWKPLLNTIFALRGSSEWFAQLATLIYSTCFFVSDSVK